ncbi:MAG: hypothetical protein PHH21_03140 [Candidatus Pacebacteria bacterium]|nr:hypothetical protein [Candidatus Paceibacterota bacterium]
MEIFDEVKKVLESKKLRITERLFRRIRNSEETMREIDKQPGMWRKLAEWTKSNNLSKKIYLLGVKRAENFDDIDNLFYYFFTDCQERACAKGLGLARKSKHFQRIAEMSESLETKRRALDGGLSSAKSTGDCCDLIYAVSRMNLKGDIEREEADAFIEKAVDKGVSLAKNIGDSERIADSLPDRCSFDTKEDNSKMIFILAKSLGRSSLRFPRKNLLNAQVKLCEGFKTDNHANALSALLNSIFAFYRYEQSRDWVPDQQRRLKTN